MLYGHNFCLVVAIGRGNEEYKLSHMASCQKKITAKMSNQVIKDSIYLFAVVYFYGNIN